jgi:hypothetical protein
VFCATSLHAGAKSKASVGHLPILDNWCDTTS